MENDVPIKSGICTMVLSSKDEALALMTKWLVSGNCGTRFGNS